MHEVPATYFDAYIPSYAAFYMAKRAHNYKIVIIHSEFLAFWTLIEVSYTASVVS
jgi:hypothetical protein